MKKIIKIQALILLLFFMASAQPDHHQVPAKSNRVKPADELEKLRSKNIKLIQELDGIVESKHLTIYEKD